MPSNIAYFYTEQQDTSLTQNQGVREIQKDSSVNIKVQKMKMSPAHLDSMLRVAEQKRAAFKRQEAQKKIYRKPKKKIDTLALKAYDADTIAMFRKGQERMDLDNSNSIFEVVDVKPQENKLEFIELKSDSTKSDSFIGIPKTTGNKSLFAADWMLIVFVLLFGFIAWARLFNVKYFNAILSAAIDYQNSFKLFRDKNAVLQRVSLSLNIISVLSLGLFFYFALKINGIELPAVHEFVFYLIICVAFALVLLWKQVFSSIMGFVLLLQKEFAEYAHNVFVYYKLMGIALIPFSLLIAYSGKEMETYLLWGGLSVLFVILLLRYGRSFRVFMQKGVSIVYLILYFCSLEILPIVLIVKAIKILM